MLEWYDVRREALPWRVALHWTLQKRAADGLLAAMPQQRPWLAHNARHLLKAKRGLVDLVYLKDLLLWAVMDALTAKRPV